MTRSQQRNHFDMLILEYEKLAQMVGTDDYLSVRTGGFINTSGLNINDNTIDNNINNAIDNSENIKLNARTEFSNENFSYIHLLAEKPAKSDLLNLYYKAARKRSLPAAEIIIATFCESSTEWDQTTRRQFHTIGRAIKRCTIEDNSNSLNLR